MEIREVRLAAPAASLDALAQFYGATLGIEARPAGAGLGLEAGPSRIAFAPGDGEPFYHVALLVPGDRFGAALRWLGERVELLPGRDGGSVFDFAGWEAQACYFHDPAGSILELIAHRGIGESGAQGPFGADELLGVSEIGLVGDPAAMAAALERELALGLWDGTVEGERSLGFVGERARTLILCPPGRGWLPTGRPAEAHPVEVVLSGPPEGEAVLADGRHRVSRRSREALEAG